MNLEGVIKKIFEEQVITASFKKREFVITTQEQYPQDILMELTQDKTGLLNQFKEGDLVSVDINVRGREWINPEGEAKYFNTLQAWKIWKKEEGTQGAPGIPIPPTPPANSVPEPPANSVPEPPAYNGNPEDDDLPF